MKVNPNKIGQIVSIRGRQMKVTAEDGPTLARHGYFDFLGDPSDLELNPNTTDPIGEKAAPSEKVDRAYLRDKLTSESLNDFEGRDLKEVKKDLDLLEIEYPKRATLKSLAVIVRELP